MASSSSSAQQQEVRPCLNCDQPCTSRCSQCRAIHFCSQECQKQLWKCHKAFCKSIANPTHAAATEPSAQKCLIVDGLGPCGLGWDDMKGAKARLLSHGVDVVVVDAKTKHGSPMGHFPLQLASLLESSTNNDAPFHPTAILVLGWGSGDDPKELNENMAFRRALQKWCQNGGHFLVQGERIGQDCDKWPSWFGKEWKYAAYFRTDHKCFASGPDATHWCDWLKQRYTDATRRPPSNYNVKACMIKDVAPDEVLFGTTEDSVTYSLIPQMRGQALGSGEVAVAYGKYGQGTVSFFGDVNHEEPTLELMAILAKGS